MLNKNSLKCAGSFISEAKAENFYELRRYKDCKIHDELLRDGKFNFWS